jgi:RNA polymerase sigma factor (sigma-70 family)
MRDVSALASPWIGTRSPERRSFAEAAEEHLDAVRRYLAVFTGDAGLADDLAAQTFERAFARWRRYDPRRGPELPWLCAIARRAALDHFRAEARRRRREERYAGGERREAEPPLVGLSPELEAALGALTAGEREVLALRVVLELDAETAARLLGIGRSACSMRLARALEKLAERMSPHAVA